ncbi:MAG: type secretion system protein, partial [Dehalococcoidia bacterium]|nr:type secretion system protein [Dehalococcoidia bacterium]
HLEPQRDGVRIRYRIDGILHEAMQLPLGVHAAIVSRLKVMAGMNIAERRRPQDGQFSVKVEQSEVDVRAATIETDNGEMVVLRILDKSLSLLRIEDVGLQPEPLQQMQRMLRAPFGAILISGPTGSGKTTTLYAGVNYLEKNENNIITIEDPVEYHFDGINQIQVNRQADITFAAGLRAIMRLDPDIILVGEIRDRETAEIAVQSALTGHLLLSSIHANNAVGSLFRMMDLGVDPLLLASAMIGSISQRLVRRICPHCRIPYEPPFEELMAYKSVTGEDHTQFFKGAGCNFCANTGYLGRTAVFEVLTLGEELRARLLKGMNASEARTAAIESGMIPMQLDGMMKAKQGTTAIHEVMRNVFVL